MEIYESPFVYCIFGPEQKIFLNLRQRKTSKKFTEILGLRGRMKKKTEIFTQISIKLWEEESKHFEKNIKEKLKKIVYVKC